MDIEIRRSRSTGFILGFENEGGGGGGGGIFKFKASIYLNFDIFSSLSLYSKTCLKRQLSKRPKMGFQDQLSLNAVQKYCRMLQGSILQYFDVF